MHVDLKQMVRVAVACALATLFAVPQNLMAEASAHLVSPAELQHAAAAASRERQRNVETVTAFLSTPRAEKAIKSAHMDLQKVKQAVSQLSDAELSQLANRAQKAQADFSAGDLSDRDLILIILGVAVLVLIIVAVR
jgi:hypothetical protein